MTYIKLLTALTALVLLTACGGGGAATGDSAQTTDCKANAFHADCLADTSALALRITDCITAGNAGDTKCASLTSDATMNTEINTCLTNPFDDTCTASDFTFSTYADMARTNRVSFCETAGNETNALCSANSGYADCIANPFATGCDAYFESAKNPYCETNPTATSCVNATVWLASFTGNEALPTTPNTTRRNQFLEILATTTATTLFMTGSTTNGLAFFTESGSYYAGVLAGTNLGAPITETITSARWTGQVRAVASESEGTLTANPTAGFGLNITFNGTGGTMKTIFANSGFLYSIDGRFDDKGIIEGDVAFGQPVGVGDARSVDTSDSSYSPGTLTGIIGQNGAVGVFHSDNDNSATGDNPFVYSGGFVVAPPAPPPPPAPCIALGNCVANYAAWESSFDAGGVNASQPLRDSGFKNAVRDTSEYIKLTDENKIIIVNGADTESTFDPVILRLNETVDEPGYESGVAYFNANGGGFVGQIYAGILPATNLGAPLVDGNKNGKWTGRLAGVTGYGEPPLWLDPFSLQVTWNGSSTEPGSMGTIESLDGGGDVGFAPVGGIEGGIKFVGDFNDAGVMWGSVNFGAVAADNGTFSGLIGAKGAVGVFEGANAAYGFAGGFVVTPPAPSSP